MTKIHLNQITPTIRHCNSLLSKAFGLIFTRNNPNRSLVFHFIRPTYTPLHMFGVFYSIDVLLLNQNNEIIELKEKFKPFTFYSPKQKAKYVIELPLGSITNFKLKLNDIISF